MDLDTKDSSLRVKNKAVGLFLGLMEQFMKEILKKIIFMVKVPTYGLMEGNISVNGNKEKCMEKVTTLGQMVVNMMGVMSLIRNMVMEYSCGQMVESMMESGFKASNTV